VVLGGWASSNAVTGAGSSDPAELLDVDVNQFAGTVALIALGGLKTETTELAHPAALQDP
jgi:hypothetical protein